MRARSMLLRILTAFLKLCVVTNTSGSQSFFFIPSSIHLTLPVPSFIQKFSTTFCGLPTLLIWNCSPCTEVSLLLCYNNAMRVILISRTWLFSAFALSFNCSLIYRPSHIDHISAVMRANEAGYHINFEQLKPHMTCGVWRISQGVGREGIHFS